MEKMDFTSLLATFGVPLKVYPKDVLNGRYEGTEWVKDGLSTAQSLAVNEPFIPSALSSRFPVMNDYGQGGLTETYDMIWFSSLVVELKTIVVHNGKYYTVEESTPYTDYANVTQYGMRGVENHEPKL
jgi:hypothetical protein